MVGRKTELNGDLQRMIVESIQPGAYDWVAAVAAGITRQTFYNWMRAGEAARVTPTNRGTRLVAAGVVA